MPSHAAGGTPQHGLPFTAMALITSDCGAMQLHDRPLAGQDGGMELQRRFPSVHFAGALSSSLLAHLLEVEGGAAEWQSRFPTAFAAETLPLPSSVSTAFVAKTLPLPCCVPLPSSLRHCLCLTLPLPGFQRNCI